MRRRFFMVANRRAGRGRRDLAEEVAGALRAAGAEVIASAAGSEAEALAEASDMAQRGAVDALIAAGGDGTIRLAAKAVADTAVPLGVVPLGTGNVLAHEIGLPRDAEALARLLLDGPATPIATATANGELFLLMVGIGFDGRVIAALDQSMKQQVGRLAYVLPVLAALAAGPDAIMLEHAGGRAEASWLIVARASRYGGRFLLTRQVGFIDGRLAAVAFKAQSAAGRVRDLVELALGRLDGRSLAAKAPLITPVGDVTVTSAVPIPVQLDGDAFGTTPVTIERRGPVVQLIMPRSG